MAEKMIRTLVVIAIALGIAEFINRSAVYTVSKDLVNEQLDKVRQINAMLDYKITFINLPTITALNSTNEVTMFIEGPLQSGVKEVPVKVVGHCLFECAAYVKLEGLGL